jgi:hypothetical protein
MDIPFVVVVILAVIGAVKQKKKGCGCGCGCSRCSGCADRDKNTLNDELK